MRSRWAGESRAVSRLASAGLKTSRSALSRCRRALPLHRVLVIFGLAGVAITQPAFDLLGRNPEFFVAGGYSRRQILLLAGVVVLVPSLVALAVVGASAVIRYDIATWAYRTAVGSLGGLFALVLLRQFGVDNLVLAAAGATAVGAGLVWLEGSAQPARTFLAYLGLGNLVFLGLFLFSSPTSELLTAGSWSTEERGDVEVPDLAGPVVVLVLDELPVTTLLRADGSINHERYPGFARLAESSTFFRNASSRQPQTHSALPELLTGRKVGDAAVPTYQNYPRNLFTLLGPDIQGHRYELVTDLCPPAICEPRASGTFDQVLKDSTVIYGHRVLPSRIREKLPAVDHSWGSFGQLEGGAEDDRTQAPDSEAGAGVTREELMARWNELGDQRSPGSQYQVVEALGEGVTAEPELHVIHVALPHFPWVLDQKARPVLWSPPAVEDPDEPNYEWFRRQSYQRHVLQVGAADTALDQLIDHLQSAGAWDDALVAVTSDHGNSLLPPDYGRTLTEKNGEELLRMPLFVKAPGQEAGEVRDDVAQLIDLVPSIADLLGVSADWDFDGHSLFDGSQGTVDPLVSPEVQPVFDLVAEHEEDFPYGDDWVALAAVGDQGDVVGAAVADLPEGPPSSWGWTVDQRGALADLQPARDGVPYVIGGEMRGAGEPPELVVALNGTIAGVAGGHVPAGEGRWEYTAFLADLFHDGGNDVAAYEVDRSGGSVTLRPVQDLDGSGTVSSGEE